MYYLVSHQANMSDQSIIDVLNSKFAKQDKHFEEIADQLVHHREAMTRVEKEMASRITANTIQLNKTTEIAVSNTAKVDTATSDIVVLKDEHNKMKAEMDEFKNTMKQVVEDQQDTKRRSYKK